jgi:hypothetical protein
LSPTIAQSSAAVNGVGEGYAVKGGEGQQKPSVVAGAPSHSLRSSHFRGVCISDMVFGHRRNGCKLKA